MKETILISSCLTGCPVRFNGSSKPLPDSIQASLKKSFNVVAVCPEMLGGLPCPREPSEIQMNGTVVNCKGQDVSHFFLKGAHGALNICKNYKINKAVLKSKSPSCGRGVVFDGHFSGKTTHGSGVTTELLERNGIRVLSEDEVFQLIK